jgi:tRNA(fMet)-specific endonuclease VapC
MRLRSTLAQADAVVVSAIVIGELFFGAEKSSRRTENVASLERFATGDVILPCDLDVARECGLVKQRLRKRGKLITRDGHFDDVEDLRVVSW